MSQPTLARYVGVSFQQIQKYENGTNRVNVSRLGQIADALDVLVTDLMPTQSMPDAISLIDVRDKNALRLIRAYGRISSKETRRKLVEFVEALAHEPD